MIVKLITNNIFMSVIAAFGVLSIFIEWIVALSLKGYVKASSNMKTTKKKVMINLKNQYEAMYEMNVKVKNMDAFVDKYIYKLRFAGLTYSGWEKLPYISAGITAIIMVAGAYYGHFIGASSIYYADILAAGGINLACLYIFFHIHGIKARKQQIHVQLVDYLENYLANRLNKTVDNKTGSKEDGRMEEDMEMLKNLIKEMDAKKEMEKVSGAIEISEKDERKKTITESDGDETPQMVVEAESGETPEVVAESEYSKSTEMFMLQKENEVSKEIAVSDEKQSEIDLLEEFVQSFLS